MAVAVAGCQTLVIDERALRAIFRGQGNQIVSASEGRSLESRATAILAKPAAPEAIAVAVDGLLDR